LEWCLSLTQLLIAAVSFLFSNYGALTIIITCLTMLAVVQLIASLRHILTSRVFGLPILNASSIFFFWIEAQYLAFSKPAFAIVGPPIPTGVYSPDLIEAGILYVTLFQVAMLIGYSFRPRLRAFGGCIARRVDSHSSMASLAAYLLAACAVIPLLATYGFSLSAATSALLNLRKSGRPDWDGLGLLQYARMFGIYAAAYFLARVCVQRQFKSVWVLLVTAVTITPFVLTGTRYLAVYVFLPALILLVKNRSQGKLHLGHLSAWGAAALLVFVVLQLQMQLRQRGVTHLTVVKAADVANVNVTYQFSSLLFARYLVPTFHPYFKEVPEPYFVIYWVPRSLWPDKPFMKSWEVFDADYTRGQHFNVTPSIIGQFYLNWGVVGIIQAGLMIGFFACIADRLLMKSDTTRQLAVSVAVGMFYAFIVSIFRFYAPMYFGYLVFGIVGAFLLTRQQPPVIQRVRAVIQPGLAHASLRKV
jgi:oligosaccharide repeat unit polymerase